MNKIKRIILNFISEEDDLVCFFICFLGKCIIICSIVYIFYSSIIDIYESYLDFNFSKQNITEYSTVILLQKKIIKVRTLIHEQSNISRTPCA